MSVTLNGHTWELADFVGSDARGYANIDPETGLRTFPDGVFADFLVELNKVLAGGAATVFVEGRPYASEVVLRYVATHAVTFPAGLTLSKLSAGTAATAQYIFSVKKNGVEFGTITVAA